MKRITAHQRFSFLWRVVFLFLTAFVFHATAQVTYACPWVCVRNGDGGENCGCEGSHWLFNPGPETHIVEVTVGQEHVNTGWAPQEFSYQEPAPTYYDPGPPPPPPPPPPPVVGSDGVTWSNQDPAVVAAFTASYGANAQKQWELERQHFLGTGQWGGSEDPATQQAFWEWRASAEGDVNIAAAAANSTATSAETPTSGTITIAIPGTKGTAGSTPSTVTIPVGFRNENLTGHIYIPSYGWVTPEKAKEFYPNREVYVNSAGGICFSNPCNGQPAVSADTWAYLPPTATSGSVSNCLAGDFSCIEREYNDQKREIEASGKTTDGSAAINVTVQPKTDTGKVDTAKPPVTFSSLEEIENAKSASTFVASKLAEIEIQTLDLEKQKERCESAPSADCFETLAEKTAALNSIKTSIVDSCVGLGLEQESCSSAIELTPSQLLTSGTGTSLQSLLNNGSFLTEFAAVEREILSTHEDCNENKSLFDLVSCPFQETVTEQKLNNFFEQNNLEVCKTNIDQCRYTIFVAFVNDVAEEYTQSYQTRFDECTEGGGTRSECHRRAETFALLEVEKGYGENAYNYYLDVNYATKGVTTLNTSTGETTVNRVEQPCTYQNKDLCVQANLVAQNVRDTSNYVRVVNQTVAGYTDRVETSLAKAKEYCSLSFIENNGTLFCNGANIELQKLLEENPAGSVNRAISENDLNCQPNPLTTEVNSEACRQVNESANNLFDKIRTNISETLPVIESSINEWIERQNNLERQQEIDRQNQEAYRNKLTQDEARNSRSNQTTPVVTVTTETLNQFQANCTEFGPLTSACNGEKSKLLNYYLSSCNEGSSNEELCSSIDTLLPEVNPPRAQASQGNNTADTSTQTPPNRQNLPPNPQQLQNTTNQLLRTPTGLNIQNAKETYTRSCYVEYGNPAIDAACTQLGITLQRFSPNTAIAPEHSSQGRNETIQFFAQTANLAQANQKLIDAQIAYDRCNQSRGRNCDLEELTSALSSAQLEQQDAEKITIPAGCFNNSTCDQAYRNSFNTIINEYAESLVILEVYGEDANGCNIFGGGTSEWVDCRNEVKDAKSTINAAESLEALSDPSVKSEILFGSTPQIAQAQMQIEIAEAQRIAAQLYINCATIENCGGDYYSYDKTEYLTSLENRLNERDGEIQNYFSQWVSGDGKGTASFLFGEEAANQMSEFVSGALSDYLASKEAFRDFGQTLYETRDGQQDNAVIKANVRNGNSIFQCFTESVCLVFSPEAKDGEFLSFAELDRQYSLTEYERQEIQKQIDEDESNDPAAVERFWFDTFIQKDNDLNTEGNQSAIIYCPNGNDSCTTVNLQAESLKPILNSFEIASNNGRSRTGVDQNVSRGEAEAFLSFVPGTEDLSEEQRELLIDVIISNVNQTPRYENREIVGYTNISYGDITDAERERIGDIADGCDELWCIPYNIYEGLNSPKDIQNTFNSIFSVDFRKATIGFIAENIAGDINILPDIYNYAYNESVSGYGYSITPSSHPTQNSLINATIAVADVTEEVVPQLATNISENRYEIIGGTALFLIAPPKELVYNPALLYAQGKLHGEYIPSCDEVERGTPCAEVTIDSLAGLAASSLQTANQLTSSVTLTTSFLNAGSKFFTAGLYEGVSATFEATVGEFVFDEASEQAGEQIFTAIAQEAGAGEGVQALAGFFGNFAIDKFIPGGEIDRYNDFRNNFTEQIDLTPEAEVPDNALPVITTEVVGRNPEVVLQNNQNPIITNGGGPIVQTETLQLSSLLPTIQTPSLSSFNNIFERSTIQTPQIASNTNVETFTQTLAENNIVIRQLTNNPAQFELVNQSNGLVLGQGTIATPINIGSTSVTPTAQVVLTDPITGATTTTIVEFSPVAGSSTESLETLLADAYSTDTTFANFANTTTQNQIASVINELAAGGVLAPTTDTVTPANQILQDLASELTNSLQEIIAEAGGTGNPGTDSVIDESSNSPTSEELAQNSGSAAETETTAQVDAEVENAGTFGDVGDATVTQTEEAITETLADGQNEAAADEAVIEESVITQNTLENLLSDPQNPVHGFDPTSESTFDVLNDKGQIIAAASISNNNGKIEVTITPRPGVELNTFPNQFVVEDINTLLDAQPSNADALFNSDTRTGFGDNPIDQAPTSSRIKTGNISNVQLKDLESTPLSESENSTQTLIQQVRTENPNLNTAFSSIITVTVNGVQYFVGKNPINSGGQGFVYAAVDENGNLVAFKESKIDQDLQTEYERLVSASETIPGKFVKPLGFLDSNISPSGNSIIVMEFIDSQYQPLSSLIETLTIDQKLSIINQIASTLDLLTEKTQILFSDISDSNIFYNPITGEILFIDLGGSTTVIENNGFGTSQYSDLYGENGKLSEVFALSNLVWQLLGNGQTWSQIPVEATLGRETGINTFFQNLQTTENLSDTQIAELKEIFVQAFSSNIDSRQANLTELANQVEQVFNQGDLTADSNINQEQDLTSETLIESLTDAFFGELPPDLARIIENSGFFGNPGNPDIATINQRDIGNQESPANAPLSPAANTQSPNNAQNTNTPLPLLAVIAESILGANNPLAQLIQGTNNWVITPVVNLVSGGGRLVVWATTGIVRGTVNVTTSAIALPFRLAYQTVALPVRGVAFVWNNAARPLIARVTGNGPITVAPFTLSTENQTSLTLNKNPNGSAILIGNNPDYFSQYKGLLSQQQYDQLVAAYQNGSLSVISNQTRALYVILPTGFLGKGANSQTSLALDLLNNRVVAVKHFIPTIDANDVALEAELQEKSALIAQEAVRRANQGKPLHQQITLTIPRVHQVLSGNVNMIIMDVAPSGTVQANSQAITQLPLAMRIRSFQLLATVLDSLQQSGIIHGDISGSNILLNPITGNLTLLDFGNAQFLDSNGRLSEIAGGQLSYLDPLMYQDTQIAVNPLTQITSLANLSAVWFDQGKTINQLTVEQQAPGSRLDASGILELLTPDNINLTLNEIAQGNPALARAIGSAFNSNLSQRPQTYSELANNISNALQSELSQQSGNVRVSQQSRIDQQNPQGNVQNIRNQLGRTALRSDAGVDYKDGLNEDGTLIITGTHNGIPFQMSVVSDGMGSYGGGDVATQIFLDTLSGVIQDMGPTATAVEYAIQLTHAQLSTLEQQQQIPSGAGIVFGIVLTFADGRTQTFHAGDVKILIVDASGNQVFLSADDSVPQPGFSQDPNTGQPQQRWFYNKIDNALSTRRLPIIHTGGTTLLPGARIFIASDGYVDNLTTVSTDFSTKDSYGRFLSSHVASIMTQQTNPQDALNTLFDVVDAQMQTTPQNIIPQQLESKSDNRTALVQEFKPTSPANPNSYVPAKPVASGAPMVLIGLPVALVDTVTTLTNAATQYLAQTNIPVVSAVAQTIAPATHNLAKASRNILNLFDVVGTYATYRQGFETLATVVQNFVNPASSTQVETETLTEEELIIDESTPPSNSESVVLKPEIQDTNAVTEGETKISIEEEINPVTLERLETVLSEEALTKNPRDLPALVLAMDDGGYEAAAFKKAIREMLAENITLGDKLYYYTEIFKKDSDLLSDVVDTDIQEQEIQQLLQREPEIGKSWKELFPLLADGKKALFMDITSLERDPGLEKVGGDWRQLDLSDPELVVGRGGKNAIWFTTYEAAWVYQNAKDRTLFFSMNMRTGKYTLVNPDEYLFDYLSNQSTPINSSETPTQQEADTSQEIAPLPPTQQPSSQTSGPLLSVHPLAAGVVVTVIPDVIAASVDTVVTRIAQSETLPQSVRQVAQAIQPYTAAARVITNNVNFIGQALMGNTQPLQNIVQPFIESWNQLSQVETVLAAQDRFLNRQPSRLSTIMRPLQKGITTGGSAFMWSTTVGKMFISQPITTTQLIFSGIYDMSQNFWEVAVRRGTVLVATPLNPDGSINTSLPKLNLTQAQAQLTYDPTIGTWVQVVNGKTVVYEVKKIPRFRDFVGIRDYTILTTGGVHGQGGRYSTINGKPITSEQVAANALNQVYEMRRDQELFVQELSLQEEIEEKSATEKNSLDRLFLPTRPTFTFLIQNQDGSWSIVKVDKVKLNSFPDSQARTEFFTNVLNNTQTNDAGYVHYDVSPETMAQYQAAARSGSITLRTPASAGTFSRGTDPTIIQLFSQLDSAVVLAAPNPVAQIGSSSQSYGFGGGTLTDVITVQPVSPSSVYLTLSTGHTMKDGAQLAVEFNQITESLQSTLQLSNTTAEITQQEKQSLSLENRNVSQEVLNAQELNDFDSQIREIRTVLDTRAQTSMGNIIEAITQKESNGQTLSEAEVNLLTAFANSDTPRTVLELLQKPAQPLFQADGKIDPAYQAYLSDLQVIIDARDFRQNSTLEVLIALGLGNLINDGTVQFIEAVNTGTPIETRNGEYPNLSNAIFNSGMTPQELAQARQTTQAGEGAYATLAAHSGNLFRFIMNKLGLITYNQVTEAVTNTPFVSILRTRFPTIFTGAHAGDAVTKDISITATVPSNQTNRNFGANLGIKTTPEAHTNQTAMIEKLNTILETPEVLHEAVQNQINQWRADLGIPAFYSNELSINTDNDPVLATVVQEATQDINIKPGVAPTIQQLQTIANQTVEAIQKNIDPELTAADSDGKLGNEIACGTTSCYRVAHVLQQVLNSKGIQNQVVTFGYTETQADGSTRKRSHSVVVLLNENGVAQVIDIDTVSSSQEIVSLKEYQNFLETTVGAVTLLGKENLGQKPDSSLDLSIQETLGTMADSERSQFEPPLGKANIVDILKNFWAQKRVDKPAPLPDYRDITLEAKKQSFFKEIFPDETNIDVQAFLSPDQSYAILISMNKEKHWGQAFEQFYKRVAGSNKKITNETKNLLANKGYLLSQVESIYIYDIKRKRYVNLLEEIKNRVGSETELNFYVYGDGYIADKFSPVVLSSIEKNGFWGREYLVRNLFFDGINNPERLLYLIHEIGHLYIDAITSKDYAQRRNLAQKAGVHYFADEDMIQETDAWMGGITLLNELGINTSSLIPSDILDDLMLEGITTRLDMIP